MNIELKKLTKGKYEYPTEYFGEDINNVQFESIYKNEILTVKHGSKTIYQITIPQLDYITIEHIITLLTTVNIYVYIQEYEDEFGLMYDLDWADIIERG